MQVEETNRPNLAGYLGDVGDSSAPSAGTYMIGGFPWWQIALAAIGGYVIWKKVK